MSDIDKLRDLLAPTPKQLESGAYLIDWCSYEMAAVITEVEAGVGSLDKNQLATLNKSRYAAISGRANPSPTWAI